MQLSRININFVWINAYYVCVAIFIVITYIGGQEKLYCSHETLYLSMLRPTLFSQMTGSYKRMRSFIVQHFQLHTQ